MGAGASAGASMSPASLPFAPCSKHTKRGAQGAVERRRAAQVWMLVGGRNPPTAACRPACCVTASWHPLAACCWHSPRRALRVGPPAGPRPPLQPAPPACGKPHPSLARAPPRCRGQAGRDERGDRVGGGGVRGEKGRQMEGTGPGRGGQPSGNGRRVRGIRGGAAAAAGGGPAGGAAGSAAPHCRQPATVSRPLNTHLNLKEGDK